MIFKEIITVYCENHMKHTNMFCWKNAEICLLKQGVHMITTGF
jgi:hypothetical protein